MSTQLKLFGRDLIPHHSLSYAEQIYDILEQEIQANRWRTGERLPGVMKMAEEIGVGTKTVQSAYERLKKDGYIRSRAARGTFLKSTRPIPAVKSGCIGVLCTEEQKQHWYQLPTVAEYQHVLQSHAHRKGMQIETRVVPAASLHPDRLNVKGGLFPETTLGIVSLVPVCHAPVFSGETDRIPLLFLCDPFETCLPRVSIDVEFAYRNLTERAIREGHRRIAYSEDAVEPDPRLAALHFRGFDCAMRQAGLYTPREVLEESRRLDNYHQPDLASHLRTIRRSGATLVVAGSLGRGMALAKAAEAAGIRLPDDLSLMSIGTAPIHEDRSRSLTGTRTDPVSLAATCLRMLQDQSECGFTPVNTVAIRPRYHPGDTYAPANG